MTHKHKPVSYRLDMEWSGVCSEGYLYGYRLTCDCGASKIHQFSTASDAEKATKAWDKAGLKEEGNSHGN